MKLTIILPTYNNEKTIDECLKSIYSQDYLKKNYEILFLDGGSIDKTLKIAKKYPVRIINNPKRVEEEARIIGIKEAKGEVIAFVDADNVLTGKDWISRMLKPFDDEEISFADTLYFNYRKNDKIGVKYQALIGGDDPIATYLGMYSRWCYLKDDWTDYPKKDEDKGDYLKCTMLNKERIPPMGSNGFLVRTKLAKKFLKERFLHSDFVYELINNGHEYFAKVKTGIVHNQPRFFPNKIRRMKRRLNKEVNIGYNYGTKKAELLRVTIYIILIIPVIIDMIRGMIKKPDKAWLFHPVASIGELMIYGWYTMRMVLER
ncbi:hypothetical protein COU61_00230 [Candidatus Pacearchaeota archaeon CG10_big_fil_rev_8_21_14_0_10_35_13]|nr:MAG: hypothetical protein COU61_00230 [Candidatus Pacearchaeota archaeon CG10_big_fil_rev_8_21_14_0_10_35_13]